MNLTSVTGRGARLSSTAHGQLMQISVPTDLAQNWARDETMVCLSGAEPFSVEALEVLIEKDFTCVTPRAGEEELDTFPNPNNP